MKTNYIVIREFSFAKNSGFKINSLPRCFSTEKRAIEFVESFNTHLVGSEKISETSITDEFGNRWDKVILIKTGSLTYYRFKIQKVTLNNY